MANNAPPLVPTNTSAAVNQTVINNLNNPKNNWIFGQVNPQNYYSSANSLILAGAVQCPPATPYVSASNTCISCQFIYDVSLKACSTCPTGSLFNYTIHQCAYSSGVTVLKNTFPGQTNYIGKQPPFDPKLTSCPSSLPYFNGSNCLGCSFPNYFDYTTSLCLTCGTGLKFDTVNHICVPNSSVIPPNKIFNTNINPSSQNYVGAPPSPNPLVSTCPPATPFFNGIHCLSCSVPFYFNFSVNACQGCSQFYLFNTTTRTCMLNPAQVYYSSSLNGVGNYIGLPPNVPVNNKKKVLGCPPTMPFSNGAQCVACPLPKFYNYQTNLCELCLSNLVFNVNTKTCVAKTSLSASKNSDITNASNFMGQVPPYNSNLLTCPPGTPYFNGLSCITCPAPSYFDFTLLSCLNCNPGFTFNVNTRLCQSTNPSFVTNTSSPNIFYNGNYSTIVTQTQSTQTSLGIPTCPTSTPYYQSTTNTCIACPSATPIYNIKYSSCMSCGPHSFFDATTHICLSTQRIPLSIARELMNTFSL